MRSNAGYVRAIRAAQRPHERNLASRIRPKLKAMAERLLDNHSDPVSDVRNQIAGLIEDFATRAGWAVAAIEAEEVPVRKLTPVPFGWRAKFIQWVKAHALDAAQGITATTREWVIEKLAEQTADQTLSVQDIAKGITAFIASRSRAMTIARTEIATASNYSSEFVAQEIGVAYDKVWLSAADERTRPTHRAANAQKADQFGLFTVGGYLMAHPCDASHGAPAKEIICCRCTTRRKYRL